MNWAAERKTLYRQLARACKAGQRYVCGKRVPRSRKTKTGSQKSAGFYWGFFLRPRIDSGGNAKKRRLAVTNHRWNMTRKRKLIHPWAEPQKSLTPARPRQWENYRDNMESLKKRKGCKRLGHLSSRRPKKRKQNSPPLCLTNKLQARMQGTK